MYDIMSTINERKVKSKMQEEIGPEDKKTCFKCHKEFYARGGFTLVERHPSSIVGGYVRREYDFCSSLCLVEYLLGQTALEPLRRLNPFNTPNK